MEKPREHEVPIDLPLSQHYQVVVTDLYDLHNYVNGRQCVTDWANYEILTIGLQSTMFAWLCLHGLACVPRLRVLILAVHDQIGLAEMTKFCNVGLPNCGQLRELRLDGADLRTCAMTVLCQDGFQHCRKLEVLGLNCTKFGDDALIVFCKEGLSRLVNLTSIEIEGCSFGASGLKVLWDEGLARSPCLKSLNIRQEKKSSSTDWSVVGGKGINMCSSLTELCLQGCAMKDEGVACLSYSLKNFPSLTSLDIANNECEIYGIKMLSRQGLPHCSNLVSLNVSMNAFGGRGLSYLCKDGLKFCSRLQSLDVSGTRFGDRGASVLAKDGLRYCADLTVLKLPRVEYVYRPAIVGSIQMVRRVFGLTDAYACITHRGYSEIASIGLLHCPNLRIVSGIELCNFISELQIPHEFAKQSNSEILAFLRQKHQDVLLTVSRIKVMFLGPGEVGKTTLVHKLTTDEFAVTRNDRTDGVEMHDWRHGSVDFQLWDFGGQDVYFNTHAMFFESRCVYLILWNPLVEHAHGTLQMLDEYFVHVLNRGSGAPILLVSTHADEVPSALSAKELAALQEKYPTLLAHVSIDSKTGACINTLKEKLLEVSLAQDHITDQIPQKYVTVEKQLKARRKGGACFSISRDVFLEEVQAALLDVGQADILLDLLHKWGVVHILPGGDIVLQPQDLADVMRQVITSRINPWASAPGTLHHADIGSVWASYESHLHHQFLALFHKCELAFPLYNSMGIPLNESLVPAMLPFANKTASELTQLCFRDQKAHLSERYVTVTMAFSVRSATFFPSLHARLRAMATLGAAWQQACFVTLQLSLTDAQDGALLVCDFTSGNIQIIFPVEHTSAASAALRSIRVLLDEAFQGMSVTDLTLEVCGEKIGMVKILALLMKTRNAVYRYIDNNGGDCEVCIAPLRVLFKSLDVAHQAEPIPLGHQTENRVDFSGLETMLARVKEPESTESDIAQLSLELMKSVPDFLRCCGLNPSAGVQVIWVAIPVDGVERKLKIVPVSPGRSAAEPWEIVEGASVLCSGQTIGNDLFTTLITDCLYQLGLAIPAAQLVSLTNHRDALRHMQKQHFEKKTIADGVEVYLQKKSAVITMASIDITESEHRDTLHTASELDAQPATESSIGPPPSSESCEVPPAGPKEDIDIQVGNQEESEKEMVSAMRQLQFDSIFNVHRMPLLLSITQPGTSSVSGWFERRLKDVFRLHFICPVCGRKAASGEGGKGYRLSVTKARVAAVATCLRYTLQAIEVISLVSPYPMPHLSQLASYLPHQANLAKFDLEKLYSEVQGRISANQLLKDKQLRDAVTSSSAQTTTCSPHQVQISLKDVYLAQHLIKSVGEEIPPLSSGLQPLIFEMKHCAWVCDEPTAEESNKGGATACGPHFDCAARYRREGPACLQICVQKG